MDPFHDYVRYETRRQFLSRGANAVSWAAFASLLGREGLMPSAFAGAGGGEPTPTGAKGHAPLLHFAPKAKQVIYLHMVGGPPQMDMYDYKPKMGEFYDKDLPDSIRMGQRLTTMTSGQKRFPIAPSKYKFARHGKSGMWVCELLPHTAKMVDEMCFIRSMHTEAINHEPAITYMQTGNQVTGRPCLGAWTSYGLGSLNDNLPTFVVLVAKPTNTEQLQAISARLWSSGYLPGEHAGVSFRSGGDPILYINNPPGVPPAGAPRYARRPQGAQRDELQARGRPRDAHADRAIRAGLPDAGQRARADRHEQRARGDLSALWRGRAKKPGTFAHSALLARRLVERGVRFVQIYHNNWDTHFNVAGRLPDQCRDVDQPCWGLIQDLKARGLLDSTLVVWGGEFGRTIYSQGGLSHENYGRDHHPRCFTMWMAGGGSRPGTIYGETDEFSYNIVKDPVHIRDFHATVLRLLGFDHHRFTYRYQGLDQKLTGVEQARVVKELLA